MSFRLRVVSLERSLYDGEIDAVSCVGVEGELGIRPRHAPLLTTLRPGPLAIEREGMGEVLFVSGGFLEVLPDRVTVLADEAERSEDIDAEAAETARRDALEHLAGEVGDEDRVRLHQMLQNAEARIRLARTLRT